jgi:thiol:disulfide interchange protein DsbA
MMFRQRATLSLLGLTLLAITAFASISLASAQAPASGPRLKFEYELLPQPQPVTTGDRIEVVEFFWYGCPHCNNLQPPLEAWLKRKPADVELRRVPAVFRESWIPHARLYYTLEALGELPRLHQSVYRVIHFEKESLTTANATAEWALRQGIEPAKWTAAYNSPEVEKKVQDSRNLTKLYAVPGTPALVVDGRYLTSSSMAESMPGVITILDGLIVMAREQRAKK